MEETDEIQVLQLITHSLILEGEEDEVEVDE